MGQFSSSGAGQLTKEVITAAFSEVGAKLLGPGSSSFAEANAKTDALYLSTLINELYAQLKGGNTNT
ncbi:hypothetical protein [Burkholderia vietnamiensis]|uniref:hypothetical protein n=1 Tax=Burkholderia vietnamiensis TaxID=60552 RepID=UPI000ACCA4B0|nr:hypothetical protein [Burkholderia vietnamiensis]